MTGIAAARSLLYTPGTRPDRIAKARSGPADIVLVDLEDSIPDGEKDVARSGAALALDDAAHTAGAALWVRIDATCIADDLEAVLRPGLAGIMVPKASPELLAEIDRVLANSPVGLALPLIGLIETAAGVLRVEDIARHPRVARLAVGEADLAGELRVAADDDTVLAGVRLQVVLASAAAGIAAPIGPVERQLDAPARLEETTRRLLRQGFRARTALHPRQVETINAAFSPTPAELARARADIARFESAGSGGAVGESGEFVDRAVLRAAREIVARAAPDRSRVAPDTDPAR